MRGSTGPQRGRWYDPGMKAGVYLVAACAAFAAGAAFAQQYRWVDEQGRVRFSDSPPPPTAKNVQKLDIRPAKPEAAPLPYELSRLQADFPVTLYTSPSCKEVCQQARDTLNRRGIPFKEVQVWDEPSNEELKKVSGANSVPTLVVGRSAQSGFEQSIYDALLDSAGYPKAGIFPARAQRAPEPPEGYASPEAAVAKPLAGPAKGTEPKKRGRYDPSDLTSKEKPRAGQYDPSGLVGPPPRTGQYAVPGQK
jgi:glutaredoxin